MSTDRDPTTPNPNPREAERVGAPGEAERLELPQLEEETSLRGRTLFRSPQVVREEGQSLLHELEDEDKGREGSVGFPSDDDVETSLNQAFVDSASETSSRTSFTMSTPSQAASMFTETVDRTVDAIEANRVKVPRDKRGDPGKEREKVRAHATAALDPKFGVPKHLVVGEGETDDGALKIQDSFMSLSQRLKKLKSQCIAYDMMTTLEISKLVDESASVLANKWGGTLRKLLDHYTEIPLHECKEWTADIMRRGHPLEVENQNWLLSLIRNSCTQSLQDKVDDKFD